MGVDHVRHRVFFVDQDEEKSIIKIVDLVTLAEEYSLLDLELGHKIKHLEYLEYCDVMRICLHSGNEHTNYEITVDFDDTTRLQPEIQQISQVHSLVKELPDSTSKTLAMQVLMICHNVWSLAETNMQIPKEKYNTQHF